MVIAIMHKALDIWSMVGIRIIHNTKINEVSKHMGQVQDNPSITGKGCDVYYTTSTCRLVLGLQAQTFVGQ